MCFERNSRNRHGGRARASGRGVGAFGWGWLVLGWIIVLGLGGCAAAGGGTDRSVCGKAGGVGEITFGAEIPLLPPPLPQHAILSSESFHIFPNFFILGIFF